MKTIICKNKELIEKLQHFIDTEGAIAGIALADTNNDDIVVLLDEKNKIEQSMAEIWWQGYQSGLGIQ